MNVYSDEQRRLAAAAAILLALGLLTGGLVGLAMTGDVHADPGSALAAHLNALLGSFWMLGVAWTLPMLSYGEAGRRVLTWLVIVPNYANWAVTAVKSLLFVKAVGLDGTPTNDTVFVILNAFVVLPSLIAAGAWAWGFRTRPATAPVTELAQG